MRLRSSVLKSILVVDYDCRERNGAAMSLNNCARQPLLYYSLGKCCGPSNWKLTVTIEWIPILILIFQFGDHLAKLAAKCLNFVTSSASLAGSSHQLIITIAVKGMFIDWYSFSVGTSKCFSSETRSVQMRLYTMHKREFGLVFLAFFACFGMGVFIGLAGKLDEQSWILYFNFNPLLDC